MVQEAQQDHEELARLGEQLCREAAHLAAAECRWLVRLAEFDGRGGWGVPGARSCAHWLGWACGLSPEAARERVRVARALPGLAQVTAAFAAGELSFSKVRAITRVATPETEAVLVEMAKSATAAQLERVVRGYRRSHRAEEARTAQAQFERRSVRWWYDDEGMVRISARLPAEDGAQVVAALRAYERRPGGGSAEAPDVAADGGGGDDDAMSDGVSAEPSTAADDDVSAEPQDGEPVVVASWDAAPPAEARAADALVAAAETAGAAAPATVGPDGAELRHVVVHVDAGRLTGDGDGDRGELDDGQLLADDTIRRLACDGRVSLQTHDSGGSPLDVSRSHRRIPRRLRRALADRDRGCRFPGCGNTHFVDAHHVIHWADGGPTELTNLVSLCRFHHRVLHEAGFTVRLHPDGTAWFHRPDGAPLPASRPPRPGEPAELIDANTRAGAAPTATSLTPDWDGRPQDIDAAIEVLAAHADRPDVGHCQPSATG